MIFQFPFGMDGYWILDIGYWILDFGFPITVCHMDLLSSGYVFLFNFQ